MMHLKILLPHLVFTEHTDVLRIVSETHEGSFGILPHRLDCAAALIPGILTYETKAQGEVFVGVDEGVLVKTGDQVLISVRRAFGGVPLTALRQAIKTEFLCLDEQDKALHQVLTKLESGFLRQFSELTRR
ncbi:MAG: F-type H+-transporting ATPase subunit epsilon [Paraglaciecola sp.]|jgi:F-type H+-transporting ATPase subunit epsilon